MGVNFSTLLASVFLCCAVTVTAQTPFRIQADFSLKVVMGDGGESLTKGTVYYDRNIGQLIYRINFPYTQVVTIENDQVRVEPAGEKPSSEKSTYPPVASVFHLALTGDLTDYGLSNSGSYKLTDMRQEAGKVISHWEPLHLSTGGNIDIMQANNLLEATILHDQEGNVMSKQLYEGYQRYLGSAIPSVITQRVFANGSSTWTRLALENIQLNATSEALYRTQ